MKFHGKLLSAALCGLLTLSCVGCNGGSTGKDGTEVPTVGIVQYMDHVALDGARQGFIRALAENGYKDGETVKIDYKNAQGDSTNLGTISDGFVSDKVDLVLAIATPAVESVASKTTTIPILGTAVTDYSELVKSEEKPGVNISGTSDLASIKDQIAMLQKLVPNAKTVGVLYTSSENNSIIQAGLAKEAIEAAGMSYVERTVSNANEVQQATEAICSECDAIYVPTDNTFATAMSIASEIANSKKIPTVVGESGMVTKGGLATVGIDYDKLGYQTGLMAVKILKGEAKIEEMPIEWQTEFAYEINKETAERIGITIPEEFQSYLKTYSEAAK